MTALEQAERQLADGAAPHEVAVRLGLRRDQVEGVAAVMRQRAAAAAAGARSNGGAARPLTAPDVKPAASGDPVEGQFTRILDSIDELLENKNLTGVHKQLAAARAQLLRVRDRLIAGTAGSWKAAGRRRAHRSPTCPGCP